MTKHNGEGEFRINPRLRFFQRKEINCEKDIRIHYQFISSHYAHAYSSRRFAGHNLEICRISQSQIRNRQHNNGHS